ncbi:hypothetical protein F4859DRAFT_160376 [Xylaria cf. heliscus]|nr:hypothetical protein F4859DRAFT_160376 [Xylaria cf. heliscus]
MSRLRVDRDTFEHIVASEHLAQPPRELVWHELDLEARIALGKKPLYPDDSDLLLDEDLHSHSGAHGRCCLRPRSLFWFPRMPQINIPTSRRLSRVLCLRIESLPTTNTQ